MRPSRTSWENKTLEISIYLLQCLDHICRKKNRMCEMIGRQTPTGSLMVLNYYFFLLQCSIIIRYKGAAILEIHFDISIDEMLFELCFEII